MGFFPEIPGLESAFENPEKISSEISLKPQNPGDRDMKTESIEDVF